MNNSKKLEIEKYLCNDEYKEVLISKWLKPKGYDLSMTQLSLSVFGVTTHLVYGKYEEFKKFIKNTHDFDTQYKSCIAMVVQLEDNGITWNYILIQENEWTASNYGTIVHELHHLVHFILDKQGVSYGSGGEEVYAYIQGYFMELIVRAFIQLKRIKLKTSKRKNK